MGGGCVTIKIFRAVATITIFAVITRVLGFALRVYLSRNMGAELMGIYQVAISVFMVLLTLTCSGIPFVVSRKTATYIARGMINEEREGLTAGLLLSGAISLGVCLIIVLFQNQLAPLFANPQSLSILIMLLPAIVFSAICSAFRGNLWGHKRWTSVSSIELTEQVVRIIICFVFLNFSIGAKAEMAALSLSTACFVSCAVSAIMYFKFGGRLSSKRGLIKPLFRESLTITGMRVVSMLISSSVALIMPRVLMGVGLSSSEAMSEYGAAMGMAFPVLYLPSTVIGALAFALVPELARTQSENNSKELSSSIQNAIIFSIAVGALFVPLFAGIGNDVGALIYQNQNAGEFLKLASWVLIPIALEQITSSVMNSINLEVRGFVNYLIGSVLLFASILLLTKYIGVHSLSVGYGLSLLLSSILDIITVKKKVRLHGKIIMPLIISSILVLPCSAICYFLHGAFVYVMPRILSMIISGCVGMGSMALLLAVFNVFDFKLIFPHGFKIPKRANQKKPQSINIFML